MVTTVVPIGIGVLGTIIKIFGKGTGKIGNKWRSRDHLDDRIIKIDQNTEKSPGYFRRLVDTQTPVENH